jgi:hypothetical protein
MKSKEKPRDGERRGVFFGREEAEGKSSWVGHTKLRSWKRGFRKNEIKNGHGGSFVPLSQENSGIFQEIIERRPRIPTFP